LSAERHIRSPGFGADIMTGRFRQISAALHARSRTLITFLDLRIEWLLASWLGTVVVIGLVKVMSAPVPAHSIAAFTAGMLPYLLLAASPIAGYRVAAGSFPRGLLSSQPIVRLCRYGRWRPVDLLTARRSPVYGPAGFMASLILGLLLNVPFRSLEFILALPAILPGAPAWAASIMWLLTFDVVIMNFFYMVCFVLAVRSVPLFPRMMLFAWGADLTIQLIIADQILGADNIPKGVGLALQSLVWGNIQKVLISAFVWLPFLVLSDRVNVTFRQRVRA
jgi:hypothetical protein